MTNRSLSVEEAAAKLHLSPQRVRALIGAGRLRADRVGGRYVLDQDEVGAFGTLERPEGRPLSPASAWALLAKLSGDREAVRLPQSSYYRLSRHYRFQPPHALVEGLAHSQPRFERHAWRVLHSDIARLLHDPRLVLTGLAANDPAIDVRYQPRRDGLDAYVSQKVLRELEVALSPEKDPRRANLSLRVPRGSQWILDWPKAPTPVVAADLLNVRDPRVRRAAESALMEVSVVT